MKEMVKQAWYEFLMKNIVYCGCYLECRKHKGSTTPNVTSSCTHNRSEHIDFDTIANVEDNIPAMFQAKIYEPAGYNAEGQDNSYLISEVEC